MFFHFVELRLTLLKQAGDTNKLSSLNVNQVIQSTSPVHLVSPQSSPEITHTCTEYYII